jgi:hypothetical protein
VKCRQKAIRTKGQALFRSPRMRLKKKKKKSRLSEKGIDEKRKLCKRN